MRERALRDQAVELQRTTLTCAQELGARVQETAQKVQEQALALQAEVSAEVERYTWTKGVRPWRR